MRFVIGPRDDNEAFLRLINIGFVTAEQSKREFSKEEWFGKNDAKGRELIKGVNPAIRYRLMTEHTVTVYF